MCLSIMGACNTGWNRFGEIILMFFNLKTESTVPKPETCQPVELLAVKLHRSESHDENQGCLTMEG